MRKLGVPAGQAMLQVLPGAPMLVAGCQTRLLCTYRKLPRCFSHGYQGLPLLPCLKQHACIRKVH